MPLFDFIIPATNAPQSPKPLGVSFVVHVAAVLLLFTLKFSGVRVLPAVTEHYVLLAPAREMPAPKRLRAPRPREFRPLPATSARLTLPAAPSITAPVIETPRAVLPEMPVASAPKPAVFAEAKPEPPSTPKLALKPSGFERAETIAAKPAREAAPSVGAFESAHSTESAPVRKLTAQSGAFGDASAPAGLSARHAPVMNAAFGDTTIEKTSPVKPSVAVTRATPVEILSKPKPAYTAEARAKNIEGEVLLEVQFSVSGEVRVQRLVRGLGHGLDETAVTSAQGIRFRPATRDGAAVDSTALVHIVFQLAN